MEIIADRLTAGFAWDWSVILSALDPAADILTLVIRGPGAIDIVAEPDGAGFRFSTTADQTGALPPGVYAWQLIISRGGAERLHSDGRVILTADLRTIDAGHDARGFAERMVAMIEAVLENRATIEQRRYQINNRSLERTPVTELMAMLTKFRAMAAADARKRAGASPLGRQFLTRF